MTKNGGIAAYEPHPRKVDRSTHVSFERTRPRQIHSERPKDDGAGQISLFEFPTMTEEEMERIKENMQAIENAEHDSIPVQRESREHLAKQIVYKLRLIGDNLGRNSASFTLLQKTLELPDSKKKSFRNALKFATEKGWIQKDSESGAWVLLSGSAGI